MRRIIHALVGIGLLVAGLATQVQAQPFRGMREQLELSQEQIAQLEELNKRQAEETRAAQAEMIKARAEIQALMMDPDRDLRTLERALKGQADLQVASQIRALTHRQALTNVLTEEQQTKLKDRGRQAVGRGMRRAGASRGRSGSRFGRSGRSGSRFGRSGRSGSRFGRSGRSGSRFGRSSRSGSRFGRAGRVGGQGRWQGRGRTRQPVGRSSGRRAIPPESSAQRGNRFSGRGFNRGIQPPPPPPA